MKKGLLLILCCFISYSAFSQWAPYCVSKSTYIPGTNLDENIGNVSIGTINNTTTCGSLVGSQGTGIGEVVGGYVHYTNFTNTSVPVPILPFGSTNTFSVSVLQCNSGNWSNSGKVFIDWNRDNDFVDAGEEFLIFSSVNGAHTKTINITVPQNAVAGVTRMRVSVFETTAANITSCATNLTWGEVEDYNIQVGKKTWDLTPLQVIFPDTISFCGENPTPIDLKIRNVGNQIVEQGKVDLFIKGLNGSNTNLTKLSAFTDNINQNQDYFVHFDEIDFPKDEQLEFTFVTYNLLDSNAKNDTLRKIVQVYKSPTFSLKTDSVCNGGTAKVSVGNFSKPSFVLWDNQSIDTSTTYQVSNADSNTQFKFKKVNLRISRGWKCNVDTALYIRINPLPTLKVYNDTTLCAGQSTLLNAVTNANSTIWRKDTSSATLSTSKNVVVGSVTAIYKMTATHSATKCFRIDSVRVDAVAPTGLVQVNDTVCLGDVAQIGVKTNDSNYTFLWRSKGAYSPLIYDTPTTNTTYSVDWYYKKCHDVTVVNAKVNPLPTVLATTQKQHVCLGFNTTITASGASNYVWNNGNTSSSQVVSPSQLTYYNVTGTDINGCVGYSKVAVYIHKPKIEVFSNKYFNNVCRGDSATLYSHGAKTYVWNQGLSADSVHKVVPTQSTDYLVIGTDEYGCKDTNTFRLSVRPSFKVTTVQDKIGCTGETVKIWVSGGKGATYQWGGNLGTDSTTSVVLGNTTQYTVSVTSSDSCQIIKTVPVTVWPKPVARASDATTCSGVEVQIEASGGSSYEWSTGSQGSILTMGPTVTTEYKVTVTNEAGCKDTSIGTIFVINPDTIKFKTPIDSYICPNIPVTLVATPYGGVWDGAFVSGSTWDITKITDTIASVNYTYLDPINGCKMKKVKQVKIIRDCNAGSQISGILSENQWNAYPNPFENQIYIEINSNSVEEATISLYDFSGRKLVTQKERLKRGQNKIELSNLNLAAGTYYIELETEHVNRQMKLIKQ